MNTDALTQLRVADVMQRRVIAVSNHATMCEAATLLNEHQIGGAPVVDEAGRCVGVLSSSDFTLRDRQQDSASSVPHRDCEFTVASDEFRGPVQIHYVPDDCVERYMTPATQTIDANLSLVEAARYMSYEQVSRLVVIDDDSRPVGIIGALDLLAAWVREVDRQA